MTELVEKAKMALAAGFCYTGMRRVFILINVQKIYISWRHGMKALCLSGSPRKNGNTSKILDEIERGLQNQGFETNRIVIPDSKIKYCFGDKSCNKTGVCVHNDDVDIIVREMYNSHLVIVASPSYWGDVTAQLKTFIDRCTPYCNNNPAKKIKAKDTKGVAVAIRAGSNKKENENLVHTIEHFLGHHDIPLISSFTVEGIETVEDLERHPKVLVEAYHYGNTLVV